MNCVCFPPINTSPHGSYWIGNWKLDRTDYFVQDLEILVLSKIDISREIMMGRAMNSLPYVDCHYEWWSWD